jgi:NAD-dependent dihydropyrimidine dehydrogenase PreA subunit
MTLIIRLPQIVGYLFHIEFVGDTLYYIISHPEESTKNKNRCMFVCPTNAIGPSFKYPWTLDLKYGISWISWGMNGRSYETINTFIKSVYTIILFSQFLWLIAKFPSMSSYVWPMTRNPNWISSKTSFVVKNDKKTRVLIFIVFYIIIHFK